MAITSGLVGPTGAELDNASNAALIDSIKFARQSKDTTINRTFEQFWKVAEKAPGGAKGFAMTPGGRAMLKAGLNPWGMDGDKVADAFANSPISAEEMATLVRSAMAAGKIDELYKGLQAPRDEPQKIPAGFTPEPGQTPPGKVEDVNKSGGGVTPSGTADTFKVVADPKGTFMIVDAQGRKVVVNGAPPYYSSAEEAQKFLSKAYQTKEYRMTDETVAPEAVAAGKTSVQTSDYLPDGNLKPIYPEAGLDVIADKGGAFKVVTSGTASPVPFFKQSFKSEAEAKQAIASTYRGIPGSSAYTASASGGKDVPPQPVTGLSDTPDGFRQWLLRNQKAGKVYGQAVSETGADLRGRDPESYRIFKQMMGTSSIVAGGGSPATSGMTTPRARKVEERKQIETIDKAVSKGVEDVRRTVGGSGGIQLSANKEATKGYNKEALTEVMYAAQRMQDSDPKASLIAEVAKQMRDEPEVARKTAYQKLQQMRAATELDDANTKYVGKQIEVMGRAQAARDPDVAGVIKMLSEDPEVVQFGKLLDDARAAAKGDPAKYRKAASQIIADGLTSPKVKAHWELSSAYAAAVSGYPAALETYVKNGGGIWFWKEPDQKVSAYTVGGGGVPAVVGSASTFDATGPGADFAHSN